MICFSLNESWDQCKVEHCHLVQNRNMSDEQSILLKDIGTKICFSTDSDMILWEKQWSGNENKTILAHQNHVCKTHDSLEVIGLSPGKVHMASISALSVYSRTFLPVRDDSYTPRITDRGIRPCLPSMSNGVPSRRCPTMSRYSRAW